MPVFFKSCCCPSIICVFFARDETNVARFVAFVVVNAVELKARSAAVFKREKVRKKGTPTECVENFSRLFFASDNSNEPLGSNTNAAPSVVSPIFVIWVRAPVIDARNDPQQPTSDFALCKVFVTILLKKVRGMLFSYAGQAAITVVRSEVRNSNDAFVRSAVALKNNARMSQADNVASRNEAAKPVAKARKRSSGLLFNSAVEFQREPHNIMWSSVTVKPYIRTVFFTP